jgi:methyl-accepting chemotaxis protein
MIYKGLYEGNLSSLILDNNSEQIFSKGGVMAIDGTDGSSNSVKLATHLRENLDKALEAIDEAIPKKVAKCAELDLTACRDAGKLQNVKQSLEALRSTITATADVQERAAAATKAFEAKAAKFRDLISKFRP